jgi:2-methylcitrate dehydratase PrpD
VAPLTSIGRWAESLRFDDIPAAAQHRAWLALRDTVGCIAAGANTPAGRVATTVATASPGPVAVPGARGVKSTAVWAAFAGAVHASAYDFDDGHYLGGAIHPSSVIVPTLAVAAQLLGDVTNNSFTTAQVVGYEVGLRAAHLLWPKHDLDDYHCTGTAAALGAAAAVTKLRGGDADAIARSIAIAWAHAPMSTFQMPMVKESIGWSAATSLGAADLAAAGFMTMPAGPPSPLDSTFPPTPFHRPGAMDDPFVASLGTVFETTNTYFKPYASCRYTHTALRSLQELMMTEEFTADDVEAIDVFTPRAAMHLTENAPRSLDHAQYSFPFVLASMLLTGSADASSINADAVTDPARLAVAERVQVYNDPALDPTYPQHYASRIRVRLRAGETHEVTRLAAPGDATDPMTEEALASKFRSLLRLGERAEPVTDHPTVADLLALL